MSLLLQALYTAFSKLYGYVGEDEDAIQPASMWLRFETYVYKTGGPVIFAFRASRLVACLSLVLLHSLGSLLGRTDKTRIDIHQFEFLIVYVSLKLRLFVIGTMS